MSLFSCNPSFQQFEESGHSSSHEVNRGAGERRAARQSAIFAPSKCNSSTPKDRTAASSISPKRSNWLTKPALDLVEIVPNASPPVCKILDFGKFRFLEQKKSAEQRKRQKIVEIKEIKLRPGIDDHDYEVKMRSVRRFFEEGDKVKVTLRFRGREMAHQDIGFKLLQRVRTETAPIAKVEAEPLMEGRQMMMVLAPK